MSTNSRLDNLNFCNIFYRRCLCDIVLKSRKYRSIRELIGNKGWDNRHSLIYFAGSATGNQSTLFLSVLYQFRLFEHTLLVQVFIDSIFPAISPTGHWTMTRRLSQTCSFGSSILSQSFFML